MAVTETSSEDFATEAPPERPAPAPPPPSLGSGAAGNDHKAVGSGFLGVALVFLLVGGVLALLMRAQLIAPDTELLTDRQYRTLFTFHGSFTVFLFALPAWIGMATAVVPLQIGAARLAFPRLQTMVLWLTVTGGALMAFAPFASGARRVISGWTLSDPVPTGANFRGDAVEFVILGVAVVLTAAVLAAVNFFVTIVKFRASGLTTARLPLFSWSVLVASAVLLLALPVLIAGLGILFVDHHYGAQLFSGLTSDRGGNPLLWPRLFWFGAYPMLWALVVMAVGAACEVVPTFARRPIADRTRAMIAFGAAGLLPFAAWGSEVTNLRSGRPLFILGALAVLAPAASLMVNLLLTLRKAAKEHGREAVRSSFLATPMLLVLGMLSVLAAGLAAGVPSALDAARSLHRNYWQVGQQHLLFFAPATIGITAAAHFWGPKVWGRHLSAGLGKLEALLLVGGAHLAFLPALILGLQDMATHISFYSANQDLQPANIVMSLGAAVFTLGAVVFTLDLLVSIALRRGRRAEPDPWGGQTLEWTTASPPPRYNFDQLPEVRSATPALDLRTGGTD